MKKSLTVALSVLALAAGGGKVDAAATITASLFSPIPATGSVTTSVSLTGSTPSQAPISGTGFSISFSGVGSTDGMVQGNGTIHAVPVAGVSGTTPLFLTDGFGSAQTANVAASGNYLSTNIGTITINFTAPETSLALLWGSIDTGNLLTFNQGDSVTGTQVQMAAAGFISNGFQGPGGSAWVQVNTTTPFTSITLTSNVASFEAAGIAAANTPFTTVPEPASVVMAATGLGLVGLVGFRARRRR
jgi:MYXO-CTERM domain-containing protein